MNIGHPISAYTVVITRSAEQAAEFSMQLEAAGFSPLACPAIAVQPRFLDDDVRRVLSGLGRSEYGWVVFTSPNGVSAMAALLKQSGDPLPAAVRMAVQGEATERSLGRELGRKADLRPSRAVLESLLAELLERVPPQEKILLAVAEETRGVLESGLSEAGRSFDRLVVYQTIELPPALEDLSRIESLSPEHLIFTFFSPSALRSLSAALARHDHLLARARIATIGPITSRAVFELGLNVFVEATEQSSAGMVKALVQELGVMGEKPV